MIVTPSVAARWTYRGCRWRPLSRNPGFYRSLRVASWWGPGRPKDVRPASASV